jgi:transposase-like protein
MLNEKHNQSDNRMNKLPLTKHVQILSMLVEKGSSCRSISRVADVSLNTVYKTLIDAGKACVRPIP